MLLKQKKAFFTLLMKLIAMKEKVQYVITVIQLIFKCNALQETAEMEVEL